MRPHIYAMRIFKYCTQHHMRMTLEKLLMAFYKENGVPPIELGS